MNQEEKIEPTGPEEGEKSQEQDPICEGCGERHPPMPENMRGMFDVIKHALEAQKNEEEKARRNFFHMAMLALPELARAVMVNPDEAQMRAQAMRTSILTLAGMADEKQEQSPEGPFNIDQVLQ